MKSLSYIFFILLLACVAESYALPQEIAATELSKLKAAAQSYAYQDNHAKAIELYQQLVTLDSANKLDYLVSLGWQYLWSAQPKLAEQEFSAALTLQPDNKEAQRGLLEAQYPNLYKARLLIKQHEFKQALAELTPLLDIQQDDIQIDIAKTYAGLEDHANAAKHYQLALTLNPNHRKALLLPLAFQTLWSLQFEPAKKLFEAYLAIDPNNTKAKQGLFEASYPDLLRARLARNQERDAKAIQYYEKLVKKQPKNILFLKELAQAYTRNDNINAALKIYHKLIFQYGDKTVYMQYAWVLLWSGHLTEAKHFFLLIKPTQANSEERITGLLDAKDAIKNEALFNLQNKIYANQITDATNYAQKILKLDLNNEDWYLQIASEFSNAGHNEASEKILLIGMKKFPQYKELFTTQYAWDNLWLKKWKTACQLFSHIKGANAEDDDTIEDALGYCIDHYQGHKAAIAYYKKISTNESKDNYTSLKLRLAYLYMERHDYQAAKEILSQILVLDPYNTEALVTYGHVLAFQDYNMQAVDWYQKALEKQPTDSTLLAGLGNSYYWLGLGDKALATYARPTAMRSKNFHEEYQAIKRAYSNRLYLAYNFLNDSDNLISNDASVEWQHFISGNTAINVLGDAGYLRGEENSGNWNRGLLGLQTYFGKANSSYGIFHPAIYVGSGNYPDNWTPFLWQASLNWNRSDYFSTAFTAKNEVVLDALIQSQDILLTYEELSPSFHTSDWQVNTTFFNGHFSDGNERFLTDAEVLRNIYRPYTILFGPAVEYFTDNQTDVYHGYYNPESYTALTLVLKANFQLTDKWFLQPYIKSGVFDDDTGANFTKNISDFRIRLEHQTSLYQNFGLQVSYLMAGASGFSSGGGGSGYHALSATVDYHYYF